MIGYDRLGSNGGLGNQMFQYAALRGIASHHGYELCIPPEDHYNTTNYDLHSFELKHLKNQGFISANVSPQAMYSFETMNHFNPETKTVRENVSCFDNELFENFQDDWNLDGFCQTEKYFEHISDQIHEDFSFKKEYLEPCQEYINSLDSSPIFLHVRRNDAVGREDYHPIVPISYFDDALSKFPPNIPCFVFTDDLDWCKSQEYFKQDRFLFNENVQRYDYKSRNGLGESQYTILPHIDLCLMSLCSGAIIANSSFSWWGAWLQNNRGNVIAPDPWYGSKNSHLDTSDIIPDRWNSIPWSIGE